MMYFLNKIRQDFFFSVIFIFLVVLFCYEVGVLSDLISLIRISSLIHSEVFVFIHTAIDNLVQVDEVSNILAVIEEGIHIIKNLNIRGLLFATLGSSLCSEIAREKLTVSTLKLFNLNEKPFYRYYSHNVKFIEIFILTLACYIYEANLTLSFILVIFVVYCFNVIFVYDYTEKIKEGIKRGFFKYVQYKKRHKRIAVSNKSKNLYNNSENLLVRLNVYAIQMYNKTEIVENYNTLVFSKEILKEFYESHIDNKSIGVFLNQLKMALSSVHENSNNIDLFKVYYRDVLSEVFIEPSNNNSLFNTTIITSLVFIVNDMFYQNYEEMKHFIKKLEESNLLLNIQDSRKKAILSIYIITFWETITPQKIVKYSSLIELLCKKVADLSKFNDDEIKDVFNICINILVNVYGYSEIKIKQFETDFCYIIHYIGNDFYDMNIKYLEEMR